MPGSAGSGSVPGDVDRPGGVADHGHHPASPSTTSGPTGGAARTTSGHGSPSRWSRTTGPDDAAVLADSLRLGFLAVLDRLKPVERAVFLLADVFSVPYAEIAETVGKSEAACRQIASRARRRVQTARPTDRRPWLRPDGGRRAVTAAIAVGDIDLVLSHLAPGWCAWPTAGRRGGPPGDRWSVRRGWPASWSTWPTATRGS